VAIVRLKGVTHPYFVDSSFTALAATQFGVVARPQLESAGIVGASIDRRVEAGIWRPVAPAIFHPGSVQPNWQALAMAALIEGHQDAVLAGRTALAMLGMWSALDPDDLPTLLVPHDKTHDSAIASVRQVSGFPVDDLVTIQAARNVVRAESGLYVTSHRLVVTSAARSCVDLAAWSTSYTWPATRNLIDVAVRMQLTSYDEIAEATERAIDLRRRGLRLLRDYLEQRRDLPAAVPSSLESLARSRFHRWGVSSLVEYEAPHPAYPETNRRVDALCRPTQALFEFDSRSHHAREDAFDVDRARDAASLERGWVTYRLTLADFTRRQAVTKARVRRACGLDSGLMPSIRRVG
jgi:hypothetical protein